MGNKNTKFFDDLSKGATWSAGVAFDRTNTLPLDQWSVFQSETEATAYLTNSKAYPGQVIAYVDAKNEMTVCVLSQSADGESLVLKPVGIIPVGDNKSIDVDENGRVTIHGFDALTNEHVGYLPRIKKVVDKEAVIVYKEESATGSADATSSLSVTVPDGATLTRTALSAVNRTNGDPMLFTPSAYTVGIRNGKATVIFKPDAEIRRMEYPWITRLEVKGSIINKEELE